LNLMFQLHKIIDICNNTSEITTQRYQEVPITWLQATKPESRNALNISLLITLSLNIKAKIRLKKSYVLVNVRNKKKIIALLCNNK